MTQSIPSACYNRTMLWVIPLLVLGFACGMLVNYLADTLPEKRKLDVPFCHACSAPQGMVNYFIFPRKCQYCGEKREPRIIFVEGIYSLLTVYLWYFPNQRLDFWLGLLLWVYFGVVIIIDLEYRLILHPVSIAGGILGLGLGIIMHGLVPTLLGGALGFLIMFALYYIGILLVKKIRKSSQNENAIENFLSEEQQDEEALGFGDVNLSGVVGLLLGWPGVIAGITLTIFLAGGFSLFYLIFMVIKNKYHAFMAIPYGPFIVFGAAILLFFV